MSARRPPIAPIRTPRGARPNRVTRVRGHPSQQFSEHSIAVYFMAARLGDTGASQQHPDQDAEQDRAEEQRGQDGQEPAPEFLARFGTFGGLRREERPARHYPRLLLRGPPEQRRG